MQTTVRFAFGTLVRLHSLNKTTLNGKTGKCGCFAQKTGRYRVQLHVGGKRVAVRPANLEQIGDPPDLVRVCGHRLTASVAAAAARLLPKMKGPGIDGAVTLSSVLF